MKGGRMHFRPLLCFHSLGLTDPVITMPMATTHP
jgi:hypothetical protein